MSSLIRALLVEDDESHRRTLARHLSGFPLEVEAVGSAEEALNTVAAVDPHVVITDVQMPGMTGFDLLRRIREHRPDVDVIVITGFAGEQGAIDAMKEGAYDYLVKPLDLDELDGTLERLRADRASRGCDALPCGEAPPRPRGLVGRHPAMIRVLKTVGAVATTRAPVLIRGETGTGKELIARTLHENSSRADHPFVAVNCASVPESLLESELFGHVRGAFTGASADRAGRFQLAGRGTIFLDEIGDTSLAFQAKLLRVLQEREYYPVGGEELRTTEARVVAATHRDLESMVEDGSFREDLYFRLRVVEIGVPPLRERRTDIPLLVRHLISKAASDMERPVPSVPSEVMADLTAREWPGNVRQLENVLTRAVVLCRGNALSLGDVDAGVEGSPTAVLSAEDGGAAGSDEDAPTLEDIERRYVQQVLMQTRGNKSAAARILEISRPRLDRMIDRHQLVV